MVISWVILSGFYNSVFVQIKENNVLIVHFDLVTVDQMSYFPKFQSIPLTPPALE